MPIVGCKFVVVVVVVVVVVDYVRGANLHLGDYYCRELRGIKASPGEYAPTS
jgi:hypothetical protein